MDSTTAGFIDPAVVLSMWTRDSTFLASSQLTTRIHW
jgi:hypothetical protein